MLDPVDLMCGARFDVIIKYIYSFHKDMRVAEDLASKMYAQHLMAFGGFIEGDYSGKNSLKKSKDSFANILNTISKEGFCESRGLVPVDKNHVIIDGAHRLSACLYYKKAISSVSFDNEAKIYDYNYFLKRGLDPNFADYAALEFCKINPKTFIAVLFPVAKNGYSKVVKLIKTVGDVIYSKKVRFTMIGRQNLLQQLYKGEEWVGKDGQVTQGLAMHLKKRFLGNRSVTFIIFTAKSTNCIVDIKENILNILGLGKHSIHINDTHSETIRIAEQILNDNSVNFLNYADPFKGKNFLKLFEVYKELIELKNKDNYCIDSGAVLAAYGMRDTYDIDYIHYGEPLPNPTWSQINSHKNQLRYHDSDLSNLIFNPKYYFYYDGIKFLYLKTVKLMKGNRNEAKDIKDIGLIEKLSGNSTVVQTLKNKYQYRLSMLINSVSAFRVWKLKYFLPKVIRPFAYRIYNLPFYAKEVFGEKNRSMDYKNFALHYSKGTSLIHRIIRGKTYEPEVTSEIVRRLVGLRNAVFIDVGANIGLISLNVIAAIPSAKIYAFEPGPHQHKLFSKTISANKLYNSIILSDKALSYKEGENKFSIHQHKHASGDGFFDTKRAGKTKLVDVDCNTLDAWWMSKKQIKVDAIKIDCEGAELWVLKGAEKLIKSCKPTIFFEINTINLSPYPYDIKDILIYCEKLDYSIKTIKGEPFTSKYLSHLKKVEEDLVAIPL